MSDEAAQKQLAYLKQRYTTAADPPSETGDYDPHMHRNVELPTTNMETIMHFIKGVLGTGILVIPEGYKYAGIITGSLFTFLAALICTYALHILMNAQYIVCKKIRVPAMSYADSMRAAILCGPRGLQNLSYLGSVVVDTFIIVNQVGLCCIYLIFVALNLKKFLDGYLDNEHSLDFYSTAIVIPLIVMMCIPNLKYLAPISTFSNFLIMIAFVIIFYYIFANLPPLTDKNLIGSLHYNQLFFGTILFAYSCIGLVVTLEANMETPQSFCKPFGVLNVSMSVIFILYFLMGLFGYWRYGDDILPSITLNLPAEEKLGQSVQAIFAVAIFTSYALQGYVPVDIAYNMYVPASVQHYPITKYLLRIGLVLITYIFAITIPHLGLFVSLMGAFCLSALSIIFPAFMDICIKWPDNSGKGKGFFVIDIILILLGCYSLISGSYSAMWELINTFNE